MPGKVGCPILEDQPHTNPGDQFFIGAQIERPAHDPHTAQAPKSHPNQQQQVFFHFSLTIINCCGAACCAATVYYIVCSNNFFILSHNPIQVKAFCHVLGWPGGLPANERDRSTIPAKQKQNLPCHAVRAGNHSRLLQPTQYSRLPPPAQGPTHRHGLHPHHRQPF